MMLKCIVGILLVASGFVQASAACPRGWTDRHGRKVVTCAEFKTLPPAWSVNVDSILSRIDFGLGFLGYSGQERLIELNLFRNRGSYLASSFRPPAWSQGLAIKPKTVLVCASARQRGIERILAHEMTHLRFEQYWGRAMPPPWINEGVAMSEESADQSTSQWYWAMAGFAQRGYLPFPTATFVKLNPITDVGGGAEGVGEWYAQAYALVQFLRSNNGDFRFSTLCSDLRKGMGIQDAIWDAYRYMSLQEMEGKWRRWMADRVSRVPPRFTSSGRAFDPYMDFGL